jgi:hypothetical protein
LARKIRHQTPTRIGTESATAHGRELIIAAPNLERRNPMGKNEIEVKESYTVMQRVFLNSRINGAQYDGDRLPVHPRLWPRRTFLQRRLAEIRAAEGDRGSHRQKPQGSSVVDGC